MMEHMGPENLAGPTLGLLISLYAVTTGSTFFLLRQHRNIFRGINIFYGATMLLSMVLVSTSVTI